MPEIIWRNQNIPTNSEKNEYDPADLERIEKDHLIVKKIFLDAKMAEAKESIESNLNEFNRQISWMTPNEISEFIDNEIESSMDFMESSLKNLPEETKQMLMDGFKKTFGYLRDRAMDWNLDSKEVDEIIQLQMEDIINSGML